MKRLFCFSLVIFALLFAASANNSINAGVTSEGLDKSLIERLDKVFWQFNNSTPGVAVAVFKEGEIVYKRGFGMANLEYDIPITTGSIFHIASISKQFTAMSILLLAQEGKLSLDDDVRKYIPEVPDFGETITIRHLAHHTSGLRDQWHLLSLAGWRAQDLKTQEDVLDLVKRQKELNFRPGEEYLYCNTGFTLLAIIVHRVSGKSLREFADENIFQPLGMKNTHFHNDMGEIVKNRTSAYVPDDEAGFKISIPNFETYGATSLFTTVEDLALWEQNFSHKRVGGEQAYKQMLNKGVLNSGEEIDYALGISHGTYRGLKTLGHTGSDAGYRANFTMFPEQRLSIIILANVSNANPRQLTYQAADILLEEEFTEEKEPTSEGPEKKEEPEPPELSPDQLSEYTGTYYSEELDVNCTIVIRDTSLMLEWRKFEPEELSPTESDTFSTSGRTKIHFTRSKQNKIDGFTLSSRRIRNLRFDKK